MRGTAQKLLLSATALASALLASVALAQQPIVLQQRSERYRTNPHRIAGKERST